MITTIHGEEVKLPKMLHEFTFPELIDVKEPVIDWSGIIWAGKDRKGLNAPNPTDLFKAWQKDVQKASDRPGKVPQHVMDYFQAVKFFSRPPKKQEAEELARDVLSKYPRTESVCREVITAAAITEKAMTPRFTWSPSKVMQFDTCPYQFAAQYYYKTLPYQETEATRWGTEVHAEAERYMKGEPVLNPEAFKMVEKWVKVLEKVPGERFIEYKMGVDSAIKPCGYDTAEGRMILDFGIKRGDELIMVDYKTGKQKDDETQLKIYALIMAILHPDVKKLTYKYIWLKDDVATGGVLERKDLLPIAKDLMGRINKMKECWANENFPRRASGLCRGWCNVVECPHRKPKYGG